MQRCVFCQAELNDGARFCRACGRMQSGGVAAAPPVAASGMLTRPCPNCGEALPLSARFCANCGRSLSSEIDLAPLAPGFSAAEHLPGALHLPGAPAGPQSGGVSVPGAPAGPQSGGFGVPHVPAGPQSGGFHVPGASAGPQSGNAARMAGRAAGKAAGRSVGSKLLGTAAGKVVAAVIAVVVVATGGTAAAVAIGHNPLASAFQQLTGHGATTASQPPPEVTYIGSDGNIWDVTLPNGTPKQLTADAKAGDPTTGIGGISYFGLAWSPDGSMLAAIRATSTDTVTKFELLMLSPTGARLWKQALSQPPLNNSVAWSPDGRSIAYTQGTQNYNYGSSGYDLEGELVIANARTGSVTTTLHYDAGPTGSCGGGVDALTGLIWLAHNARMGINTFDWSPDGKKVLVAFDDAGLQSALVALSDGATASGYPQGASFQPDGHLILGSGNYDAPLELTDLTGKQVRVLANTPNGSGTPLYEDDLGQATWSSDGKTIYYEYQDGIWRINVDGSGARQLIAGTKIINNQVTVELVPRLSPDGSRLLYLEARGVLDDTGYTSGSATAQWYVALADGSKAFALPRGAISPQQFTFEAIWRPEK